MLKGCYQVCQPRHGKAKKMVSWLALILNQTNYLDMLLQLLPIHLSTSISFLE